MYSRPPRMLSQRSYKILQEIRNENDRLRQIDQGLGLRPIDRLRRTTPATSLPAPPDGIGIIIDAEPLSDGNWRAA